MSALREGMVASFEPSARTRPLRAGVVGCGKFGGFHTGKYAQAPNVELVGVFDADPARAAAMGDSHGCRVEHSLDALLAGVDAVSITAPARFHYVLAKQCLEAGVHVLVEKPIALDLAHADELIGLAQTKGLILQVGHQERFVFASFGLFDRDVKPTAIEARRIGPYTGRCSDVSVVFDLMIHDLDLMHSLMGEEVVKISAAGRRSVTDFADEVEARLTLAGGCDVVLECSRMAGKLQRNMRLVYPDGEIFLDLVNRALRNTTPARLESPFEKGTTTAALFGDPLGASINDFIHAIRAGRPPRVTGQCGRRALATALQIEDVLAIDHARDVNGLGEQHA